MTLNFSRLSWHAQIGLFVVVAVAGTAAFWNFYAQPAQARLAEQRASLDALKADIARAKRTARDLQGFRERVATLEADLAERSKALPEEQDVADLLRRVQAMATESRLAIKGFTPRAVTRQQLHAEWPIGLQIEGTYHDLGMFLERVSKFPRIINVGDIRISARENQSAAATITADCTATTFVLLEAKTAEAAETKKKPAKGAKS